MRHCVFCCINEEIKEVQQAIIAANNFDVIFGTENDCVECAYHSKISINRNDGGNTSVWFENIDTHQLIQDCMRWASEWKSFKGYMNLNKQSRI